MKYFTRILKEIEAYRQTLEAVRKRKSIVVTGPSDSQKAHICYALLEHSGAKGIYISYNELQARQAYEDFSVFLGEEVLFFPSREILLYDVEARSNQSMHQRLGTLQRIISGEYRLIVTSPEAAALKLPCPEVFRHKLIAVDSNSRISPQVMAAKLVCAGYERVLEVEGKGQFSIRGGILDIFGIGRDNPVRIELFGDEVDSMRYFDPKSQRSVHDTNEVEIIPSNEVIYPDDKQGSILCSVMKDLDRHKKVLNQDAAATLQEKIEEHLERISSDRHFSGIDRYIPYIFDSPAIITEYAGEDAIVFRDEPDRAQKRLEVMLIEQGEQCSTLMEKGLLLPGSCDIYLKPHVFESRLEKRVNIYLSTLPGSSSAINAREISINSRSLGSYEGQTGILAEDLRKWKEKKCSIAVFSGTESRAGRIGQILSANGIEAVYTSDTGYCPKPGQVVMMEGSLARGFEYLDAGLVIVSEAQLVSRERKHRRLRNGRKGRKIDIFAELRKGDYVVHQAHGIGRYEGLQKLTADGVQKDYMKIVYRDGDVLYIPSSQLDFIQKYIGAEGKTPRLNKLGGSDWARTKKKVKNSIKKLAVELVKLYALRQTLKGYAYPPDTVWQKEFEDLFPYEETEDQLKCTEEIKKDMESEKPVDRLLCGDVGYGKTEVAMRAAFKAVTAGKQVACLVPTTVLAQQHYNTLVSRMKTFPVRVEMLSRFRTKAQQNRILEDLKRGIVDIIVGTHRILSKDIAFKDLGLLIVDEEQRFGVLHKEKIKNLTPDIDVITLTATPIPRTLHMSLAGIRDISLIEQPPEDRYPVQTYVMEYNRDIVREAIIRELARGGQVFYLSNRVQSIDSRADSLRRLVPDARVDSAHGQMAERQLENTMMRFVSGEFDVLVCTTIIESGLDMPNVNTIIVEDADRMGLSQLYQLRGRVGRSNRLAYAYITYRRDKVLAEIAGKRLQAIKEFTEFGSGFKIAMRDLEIRGAGNLLGPEQHGHIATVGYDMYCRLLEQSVRELKGEPEGEDEAEVTVDLNADAYLDSSYISADSHRIEMYKKIASIESAADMQDVQDELIDRFGDPPPEAVNLVEIAFIKSLAKNLKIASVTQKKSLIILGLEEESREVSGQLGKLTGKYRGRLLFNAGRKPYIQYKPGILRGRELLVNIKILLQDMKSFEEE